MNNNETAELLRTRRGLTGETYNEDTVDAWQQALGEWDYKKCRDALVDAARTERRIAVAHVVAHLPARPVHEPDRHSSSCICAGRGWVDVTPDVAEPFAIAIWARCPNGPPSGFYELD